MCSVRPDARLAHQPRHRGPLFGEEAREDLGIGPERDRPERVQPLEHGRVGGAVIAQSQREATELRAVRDSPGEWNKGAHWPQLGFDVSVPTGEIGPLADEIGAELNRRWPELVAAVKAGEVSISAAAVIAELSAEEQAAAAAGGKKELRQAAKRVREAKGGKKSTGDAVADVAVEVLGVPTNDEGEPESDPRIALLRAQVSALQDENTQLRAQVADLQAQLAAAKHGATS